MKVVLCGVDMTNVGVMSCQVMYCSNLNHGNELTANSLNLKVGRFSQQTALSSIYCTVYYHSFVVAGRIDIRIKLREPGGSVDLVKNNKPRFVVRLMVNESAARTDHPTFVIPQSSRGR